MSCLLYFALFYVDRLHVRPGYSVPTVAPSGGCLGPREFTSQTASRSVYPLCRARDRDQQTHRVTERARYSVDVGRMLVPCRRCHLIAMSIFPVPICEQFRVCNSRASCDVFAAGESNQDAGNGGRSVYILVSVCLSQDAGVSGRCVPSPVCCLCCLFVCLSVCLSVTKCW